MPVLLTQLDFVRAAGSTRPWLVGHRLLALLWVTSVIASLFLPRMPDAWWPIIVVGFVTQWALSYRRSVWVERDRDAIRLRRRSVLRYGADAFRRTRPGPGAVLREWPVDTPCRYEPDAIAWWRGDRTLMIGDTRISVYPESRDHAEAIADGRRWKPQQKV